MDEQEAIASLQQGGLAGLRTLVERHQVEAVQLASLITGDRETAEDVVQQAFMRLPESIRTFDGSRPFRPWFLRLVTRDAIKAARRRAREVPLPQDDVGDYEATLGMLSQHSREPEDALERQELIEAMQQAIARLSPRQRAAVVARYYTGLSTAEAAESLHIAPGTLRWHLSQAWSRLRILLRAYL